MFFSDTTVNKSDDSVWERDHVVNTQMHIWGKNKQILSKVCPCDLFRISYISIKVLDVVLSTKYMVGYMLLMTKEKKKIWKI